MYFAAQGIGSFMKTVNIQDKNIIIECDLKLEINKLEKNNEILQIICSRSHQNSETMQEWLSKQKKYSLSYSGSSIKFCLIAEGKADVYPRFRPTSEWDTAAGEAIVHSAGGHVVTASGDSMNYNLKETYLNPNFIVSNDRITSKRILSIINTSKNST